ncbi:hypothetical protein PRNP1_011555 [Phytophthora ramorum]
MQPPHESKPKVSEDDQPKKRKAPVKKTKSAKPDADPVQDATPRSPGPYRGKCLYQSRKCENERAIKRNGKPHNLCEEHRSKQNQHQRKFDAKKFSRKRRRGSESDDDEAKTEGPPAAKHHRTGDDEAGTMTTPMVAAMRSSYPPLFVAGSTRLPSIRSPLGPSPALVYSAEVGSEAYPRGHVGPGTGQQMPHVSRRPYLQQNLRSSQALPGYSQSELAAASTLMQPQSVLPSVATPVPAYFKQEQPVVGDDRGQARTTPRVLPSLRVPLSTGLAPSPFLQGERIVPSPAQGFASAVATPAGASVCPSRPLGTILPPFVPFGLRRSPMSPPNSQNK